MNRKNSAELIVKSLDESLHSFQNSEKYRKYLSLMSRFHRYSFRNTLLIYRQRPDATYVAGYCTWQNDFDRHVKKGEKAIRIFAPLVPDRNRPEQKQFRCVSVFDIAQTEGKPLDAITEEKIQGTIENEEAFLEALKHICPVPVICRKDMDFHGCYDPQENLICLNADLPCRQSIRTLIHEMAHAILHAHADYSRRRREVEAESVAYTVCTHYGLDTSAYSFGYIAGWMEGEQDLILSSMRSIVSTSSLIITRLDALLLPKFSARTFQPA